MTRRTVVVLLFAVGAAIFAAPLASAATDLYSNVGPGGSIGEQVSRYPLSHYALDRTSAPSRSTSTAWTPPACQR